MAKKSFTASISGRHTDIEKTLESFDMDNETKQTIEKIEVEPSKENVIKAIEIIEDDKKLNTNDKEKLKNIIKANFVKAFNFDNCPDDYESLKEEAKFLAGMTQYSFLLMAQRLLKIKDNKLYEVKYPDFKSFVEAELDVSRQTAYKYLDIINYFGVAALRHEEMDYSKLIPVIPLLKSKDESIPKEVIRQEFIERAKKESFREITEDAKELKIKYGLTTEKSKTDDIHLLFLQFVKKLPNKLTAKDLNVLQKIGSDIGLIVDQNKTRGGAIENWKETFFKNV